MPRLIANSVLKKLLIALAGLAFLPAALAGSFCSAVLPGLCVSGKLTNGLADVTITAPPGIWWLAFSIGSTMPGADLMVFFPPSAASSVLLASDRHAKGFSTPLIDSRNDIVLQADSVRHSNGSMVIHFTRALSTGDAGDRDFQTGKQGYGWAWRYAPVPTQQMNSDMDLSVHDATEGMEFELLPAGAAGGGSIPVATPGAETLDQYNKILVAHGAVMFLAWVGLAPVGAWMVRYRRGKPSFAVHWYLMVPVLLFTLIGLGLAIGYTSVSSRTHFTSSHAILGIVFILLALFQGTLGFYIHAKRVPSGELRPARNWGHRLFGLVVFILGIATLILGYIRYAALYGLSRDGIAPYLGAAIGWVILWFVAGEAWRVSESLRARRESRTDSQREIKDDFDVSVDGGDIKETVDWHQVVANREKLAA